MAKHDETMNLDELGAMLSDVSTDGLDLESIITEITGDTQKKQSSTPSMPIEASQQVKPTVSASVAVKQEGKTIANDIAKNVENAVEPDTQFVTPVIANTQTKPSTQDKSDEEALGRQARHNRRQKIKETKQQAVQKTQEALLEELGETQEKKETEALVRSREKQPQAPKRKTTRKEARAARIAAELAEEAAEIVLRNPGQAFRSANRTAQGLSARSTMVGILFCITAYVSLAQFYEVIPLPESLAVAMAPTTVIGILLGAGILGIILGMDVFGKGFADLLIKAPSRNTLISFGMIASVLHCAAMLVFEDAGGVTVPYMAANLLLFYAAMREERNYIKARARTYKVAETIKSANAIHSHYDKLDDVCRAKRAPLADVQDFLTEVERPDSADRFSMIYAPIALAATIVLSLLCSVARGQAQYFFWALSGLLCVSTPLGLVCAFGASYNNTARKLLKRKAAIAGARQASLLRDTEEVVITDSEIYPAGSISVHALQSKGKIGDDKLIAAAAAVATAAGLEVGNVLTQVAKERYNLVLQATDVKPVEGGLTGQIGVTRVILGSPSLMVKLKVPVRAAKNASDSQMYVVMDDTLVGIIVLHYQPTKQVHKAMRTMRQMHMSATLAVRDFNISPTMVESEFDMKRGFADQPALRSLERMRDDAYTALDAPAAILIGSDLDSTVQVLKAADKLAGSVRSNLTLGAFAGICGMLIVFYMLFQQINAVLTVTNLLLYLLIWYVPTWIITLQTK